MEKGTMKISRICEKILAAADLENMAGLAVGIMAGGEICTGTRGYRNIENGELMDADTIFHCASISKTFTSTAVMKLVEEGKLRLDDKLVDVLPYLSIADKRCQKIEINHMLSHISGLQDAGELGWKAGLTGADALKNYAFANEVTDRPMLGEPGNCTPMYSDMACGVHSVDTKSEIVKILHFKQFYKHYVFNEDGDGGRKKVLKNYIDVYVCIDMVCGDTKYELGSGE